MPDPATLTRKVATPAACSQGRHVLNKLIKSRGHKKEPVTKAQDTERRVPKYLDLDLLSAP